MISMHGSIEVKNIPEELKRYIVARVDHGELWFWGSWDEKDKAREMAAGFDNGVVIEKRADEVVAKAYSAGYANGFEDGFSEGMHEKRWRDIWAR